MYFKPTDSQHGTASHRISEQTDNATNGMLYYVHYKAMYVRAYNSSY